MKVKYLAKRISLIIPVLMIILPESSFADTALDKEVANLKQKLVNDGINTSEVERVFSHPDFEIIKKLLNVNIKQPDAKPGYSRFVGEASVRETSSFLGVHKETFEKILKDSNIEPGVVAAILQVESNLGKDSGKYPLLNVFASLSLLDTDNIESIAPNFWNRILEDSNPSEHAQLKEKARKKAKRKAKWAYKELITLFNLSSQEKLNPIEVKGSWAGAFGMPQFLPSSYSAYARDGNGDSIIDLYNLEDAIASVKHYLSRHGYRKDITKKRRKAVWSYNHSEDYVDCILTLADKTTSKLNNN